MNIRNPASSRISDHMQARRPMLRPAQHKILRRAQYKILRRAQHKRRKTEVASLLVLNVVFNRSDLSLAK